MRFLPKPSFCCGYGTSGKKTKGFDCAIIPGAYTGKTSAAGKAITVPGASRFCGRSKGLGAIIPTGAIATTICSE